MRKCIANENTARLTKYKVGEEVKESYAVCHVLVSLGNAEWADEKQDAIAEPVKRRGRPTNAEREARAAAQIGASVSSDFKRSE